MNIHVNAISNRLSLRQPQRDALDILARVCEIIPLEKGSDAAKALETIKSEFSTVSDFEREFLSQALRRHNGNITRAAEDVGMYRQNFQQKMRDRGLVASDDE